MKPTGIPTGKPLKAPRMPHKARTHLDATSDTPEASERRDVDRLAELRMDRERGEEMYSSGHYQGISMQAWRM
tara:strand:- start:341 stop:559 length:219 start_codon:yes stop_codon:yes gene_type:complete